MDFLSNSKRARQRFTRIPSWCLQWLLPSFLSDMRNRSETPKPNIRSTAWLDGLRGWASFIVFFYHFLHMHHLWTIWGYGYKDNTALLTLPLVRLVIAGPGMVALFYVVSGYSLAWGPLKALQSGHLLKCYSRLGSSAFRRALRLFVPPICVGFIVVLAFHFGAYSYSLSHYGGWRNVASRVTHIMPPHPDNLWESLRLWLDNVSNYVYVLTFDPNYTNYFYTEPAYTIPWEFKFSMILFIVILSTVGLRPWPRLAVFVATMLYSAWYANWIGVAFQGGLSLLQLNLLRGKDELGSPNGAAYQPLMMDITNERTDDGINLDETEKSINGDVEEYLDDEATQIDFNTESLESGITARETKWQLWKSPRRRIFDRKLIKGTFHTLLFLMGVFMLSVPEAAGNEAPGYIWLYTFTPWHWDLDYRSRFITVYGSLCVVYAVSQSRALQGFFSNALSRYLGRLSFGIYLVHEPVIFMLGFTIIPNIWKFTNGPLQPPGTDPGRTYEVRSWYGEDLGIAVGACIIVPAVIYVADMFARVLDEPLVRLLKKMEDSMSAEK